MIGPGTFRRQPFFPNADPSRRLNRQYLRPVAVEHKLYLQLDGSRLVPRDRHEQQHQQRQAIYT